MRRLITKFMHINVGLSWPEDRIPDDVQQAVRASNSDSTYLYNVDFIGLKDILLSEKYVKDRDALIRELKNSEKKSFKREEIKSLIPTSNWEKYFSNQVNCDSEELRKLWTKQYEIRCKVAHNKTFSKSDLEECEKLSERLNAILNEAIGKLDDIHIDKDDAEEIVEDVASSTVGGDSIYRRRFLNEWRKLSRKIFETTTPLQVEDDSKHRLLSKDARLLVDSGHITRKQLDLIRVAHDLRNKLVHNVNDLVEMESWESLTADMIAIRLQIEAGPKTASDQ